MNKKRIFLFVVLVLILAGGVFAQSDGIKNWVSGEVSILGGGVRYEYMLFPNLSLTANAYINTLIVWNDWGFTAGARYYPFSQGFIGGLFGELALGFGYHSGVGKLSYTDSDDFDWEYNDWVKTLGFVISPGVGLKIDVGPPGGFYIQPGLKVPIVLGSKKPVVDWFSDYKAKFGVGVGFLLYVGFGYAF